MPTPDSILIEIEKILDRVIKTAERLKEISRQVVAEEELAPLQTAQEQLVKELRHMDAAFQKIYKQAGEKTISPARERIEKKLEYFQTLNAGFIDNLSSSHGLIKFDDKKKKKEPKTKK